MKTARMFLPKLALALLLVVLAAASAMAQAEAPRGTWMAEWLQSVQRSMGVLELRDGKVSFSEQTGGVRWEVELANIKRVSQSPDGRAVMIVTTSGDEYLAAIMDPSLTRQSPKKAVQTLERAVQALAASRR